MHHVLPGTHSLPSAKGTAFLSLCVLLHITCVKSGYGSYDFLCLVSRFGVESVVSVISGVGSICLAVIMGHHYMLRNKLLKKELEEGKESETD
jgi:hypothetical protein